MRQQTIGSLGLFDSAVLHFDDVETGVVQSLADVATIAILQERALSQAVVLAEQLQSALSSRIVIEQAEGMLARSEHTTLDVAFEILRRRARSTGRRLRDVAQAVLDGDELSSGPVAAETDGDSITRGGSSPRTDPSGRASGCVDLLGGLRSNHPATSSAERVGRSGVGWMEPHGRRSRRRGWMDAVTGAEPPVASVS